MIEYTEWCTDCGHVFVDSSDVAIHSCPEKKEREEVNKLGKDALYKWSQKKYQEQLDKMEKDFHPRG